MKIKFIKNALMLFALSAAIVSCNDDDQVGHSTTVPTSPTISIDLDFSAPVDLVEDGSVYNYTVSLSETQVVDVKLYVEQISGTADSHDYEMDGSLVIPAGYLSAEGQITILEDDVIEDTETLELQIGDQRTANAALNVIRVDFTILNYTSGDLVIDLGWALSEPTTDNSGEEISATDFADMRLLVSTSPNNVDLIGGADGSGFETYVFSGSQPDGEYYVVADFYAANEDIIRDIDLNLEFNQSGLINGEAYEYPMAISNASICPNNFYVLTKIIKSGDNYTFEDQSLNNFENAQITWLGIDADFDSQVTTGVDCDGMLIAGLNAGWMTGFWGEVIEDAGNVYYTVDAAGVVTIASQFLYTTTYNGDVQTPYYIEGTGTYDETTGELNIQYYLDQDGFSPSNWAFDNGYQTTPYFEAILTVN